MYHKTWIDGVDGTMFWKRAVMVHTSPDFESWEPNPGKLCVYPDELDGDNAYLPTHDRTGRASPGISLLVKMCSCCISFAIASC